MTKFPLSVFNSEVVVLPHTGVNEGVHQISFRHPFQRELFCDSVNLCV